MLIPAPPTPRPPPQLTNKVRMYIKSTTVYVYVGIGTLPTPLSPASVPSPSPQTRGGGTHSPAGEGLGESQFRRLEKKLSTLPTLWILPTQRERNDYERGKAVVAFCLYLLLGETWEYWMIYRGPGFLAVVWFDDLAPPLPPAPPVLCPWESSSGDTQEDWERETTCWREGRGVVLYKSFNTLWGEGRVHIWHYGVCFCRLSEALFLVPDWGL